MTPRAILLVGGCAVGGAFLYGGILGGKGWAVFGTLVGIALSLFLITRHELGGKSK